MKKGKKMPSIDLEGHSDARFTLIDGKIVRVEAKSSPMGSSPLPSGFDRPLRGE